MLDVNNVTSKANSLMNTEEKTKENDMTVRDLETHVLEHGRD